MKLSRLMPFLAVLCLPDGLVADDTAGYDWQLPNNKLKLPFQDEVPIVFVSRTQNLAEWENLPAFWNEGTETVVDPTTGRNVTRKIIKVKLPLGLTQAPPVPLENPLTLAKFQLGKKLYFDPILSSDNTVSCASCHSPAQGFSVNTKVAKGIGGNLGGMNSPTVINSAYNRLQFWDGRADSLEAQAQGPVGNPLEMFDGKGNAWHEAIKRIRKNPEYVQAFQQVFGTLPTRDAVAKAIGAYERLVLSGNSLYDRAEVLMRKRVEEEETGDFKLKPIDFRKALSAAAAAKDTNLLSAVGLAVDSPAEKLAAVAQSIDNGRVLFFGKARCSTCHVGDSFTDQEFHNLGVGAKDGKLPEEQFGRFASQPTGAKNPNLIGAFKTPPLRALLSTGPYMHDGSEKTLEQVVEFYNRGGNANPFLDPKMRDIDAERKWREAAAKGQNTDLPAPPAVAPDGSPIIPLKLNLTPSEIADLVLFLKALQGDPLPAILNQD